VNLYSGNILISFKVLCLFIQRHTKCVHLPNAGHFQADLERNPSRKSTLEAFLCWIKQHAKNFIKNRKDQVLV
jgi:hypothetical protein